MTYHQLFILGLLAFAITVAYLLDRRAFAPLRNCILDMLPFLVWACIVLTVACIMHAFGVITL